VNFFDNGLGVTADSISYYRDNRFQLGTIIAAEVVFPGLADHYPYCFELRDDRGNRMFLSGLTAGYPGEGPRAAMELLVDAGFPATDARRVFHDQQVTLRQPTWPSDALPQCWRWRPGSQRSESRWRERDDQPRPHSHRPQ
jgi:hypothetical protein